jgi:hypothetical protein
LPIYKFDCMTSGIGNASISASNLGGSTKNSVFTLNESIKHHESQAIEAEKHMGEEFSDVVLMTDDEVEKTRQLFK